MNYAYIRVSTEAQSYDGQRYEIEQWCMAKNIEIDRWVCESISGQKSLEKRTLGRLLRKMKPGDLLLCTELSRIGRNMMMVMSILNFCSQKHLRLYSIKDNFVLEDNINSKIIAFAFALAAEIERNLISQRTKEALAAKKQAGVKLGRPRGHSRAAQIISEKLPEIKSRLNSGESISSIADSLDIHRNTLARHIKELDS